MTDNAEVETVYSADSITAMAFADLLTGIRRHDLWLNFAVYDIKQRFRRSILGPIWISVSTSIMVASLALVYTAISPSALENLIPYLAAGLITWQLITSTVIEGTSAFTNAEKFIRSVPMPLSVHILRLFCRNIFIWMFNMVVFVVVAIIFGVPVSGNTLLFIPGILLLMMNLLWICFVVAAISTRYRDIPQLVASVMQVLFFLTPIFWTVATMSSRARFVDWNPLYHLIEIVRSPLLGQVPSAESYVWAVALLIIGIPILLLIYRRAYARISYWI